MGLVTRDDLKKQIIKAIAKYCIQETDPRMAMLSGMNLAIDYLINNPQAAPEFVSGAIRELAEDWDLGMESLKDMPHQN